MLTVFDDNTGMSLTLSAGVRYSLKKQHFGKTFRRPRRGAGGWRAHVAQYCEDGDCLHATGHAQSVPAYATEKDVLVAFEGE